MDELTLDGKIYISSKRAAKITGYAKDYVGQLCREGRVEARLVGRNWYILESSIKEHRFGAQPVEASLDEVPAESDEEIGWKGANYVSETPSQLPTVDSEAIVAVETVPDTSYNPTIGSTPAIEEMQSAWHDWFSRTNELKAAQETLLESPEMLEERAESMTEEESEPIQPEEVTIEEAEEVPVAIERLTEVVEEYSDTSESEDEESEQETEEEVVSIHRTFAAPARPVAPTRPSMETYMPQYSAPIYAATPAVRTTRREAAVYEAPMGRIISERRVIVKKKPSILLRTLFIIIALIAVVIAVIGSGKADQFIGNTLTRYNVVEFFLGEKSFDKSNK